MAKVELPRQGTLWTWTVQRFMPKSPYRSNETAATFRPYGVGYIELPGALRIEARLTETDPAKLRIGAPMRLVFYVHRTESDGTEIINYAFAPQ
ncbi:MAG: OB-fold domain-containing protein [Gammaproteobacteria bacterium]|nr:OB-fold domain-containing protein [Gammaproteobacteria bacterium]